MILVMKKSCNVLHTQFMLQLVQACINCHTFPRLRPPT